jgi:PrcB C-terminal
MSIFMTVLFFGIYSCMALPDDGFPKIIAKSPGMKGSSKSQGIILKNNSELSKFLDLPEAEANQRMKQTLKVDQIDFANQMILVIQGGECKSGGFKVAFEKFEIKNATLHVLWKLQAPPADAFVTQALTYPSLILLVEKHKGEIIFKQIIDKKN